MDSEKLINSFKIKKVTLSDYLWDDNFFYLLIIIKYSEKQFKIAKKIEKDIT